MKTYTRVMLGKQSAHAEACFAGNFVGADYGLHEDLSGRLPEDWRDFNSTYTPIYLSNHPGKTRIAAGLACGALWTVAKGIRTGDVIVSPDGKGRYHIAEVVGEYTYAPGEILPHRRSVRWFPQIIERTDMSEPLRRSAGAVGTVSNLSQYSEEIERLLGSSSGATTTDGGIAVEDKSAFALETHLQEFLIENWPQTELGKQYDLYEEDGELVAAQYATDTGPLDILAISKDKKTLLVVELKKGRASDAVVGQVLRYMGYVSEELAEDTQMVAGAIIALEDDQRIRRALSIVRNVTFYRYQVTFRLVRS